MDNHRYRRAADAIYAAGHYLLTNDRAFDALDVFRTLLLVAPSDERGWLGLGASHQELGESEKALELYRLADAAVGNSVRIELARAGALRLTNDVAEMRESLERATELAESAGDATLIDLVQRERGVS
jgi:tetratricopeptide (TPR) repeat protein